MYERRSRGRSAPAERKATPLPSEDTLKKIIVDSNVKELVEWAETVGRGLAENERLTMSQIRGFFGMVRRIEASVRAEEAELSDVVYRQLLLLKPKLAYQAQRERESRRGEGVARLEAVLHPAIDLIGKDPKRFRSFVDFFEAILAYHKAAGGRD